VSFIRFVILLILLLSLFWNGVSLFPLLMSLSLEEDNTRSLLVSTCARGCDDCANLDMGLVVKPLAGLPRTISVMT
jgi:hypothetical protein